METAAEQYARTRREQGLALHVDPAIVEAAAAILAANPPRVESINPQGRRGAAMKRASGAPPGLNAERPPDAPEAVTEVVVIEAAAKLAPTERSLAARRASCPLACGGRDDCTRSCPDVTV